MPPKRFWLFFRHALLRINTNTHCALASEAEYATAARDFARKLSVSFEGYQITHQGDPPSVLEIWNNTDRIFFLQVSQGVSGDRGGFWIHEMAASPPGTGLGTTVLHLLCSVADEHMLDIALNSLPHQGARTPIDNLEARREIWLRRLGFEIVEYGDESHIRRHQKPRLLPLS